jgi:quercetin dioxygenase-like cupin family protein
MKKLVLTALLALCAVLAFAYEIPKGLLDSQPAQALLINLDQYYAQRALPDKPSIDVDKVYASPRSQVEIRTILKGFTAGPHFHANSDEIVIVVGGSGEILVNGEWKPVKKGDLHINPRGCVHATRALTENMRFLSIYTPQLPQGGDANPVN